jgi:hypothetical protein
MGLVKDNQMATVSIVKATYSDPEIETLLAPLGGMEQFVKKSEKGGCTMSELLDILGSKYPIIQGPIGELNDPRPWGL